MLRVVLLKAGTAGGADWGQLNMQIDCDGAPLGVARPPAGEERSENLRQTKAITRT